MFKTEIVRWDLTHGNGLPIAIIANVDFKRTMQTHSDTWKSSLIEKLLY